MNAIVSLASVVVPARLHSNVANKVAAITATADMENVIATQVTPGTTVALAFHARKGVVAMANV